MPKWIICTLILIISCTSVVTNVLAFSDGEVGSTISASVYETEQLDYGAQIKAFDVNSDGESMVLFQTQRAGQINHCYIHLYGEDGNFIKAICFSDSQSGTITGGYSSDDGILITFVRTDQSYLFHEPDNTFIPTEKVVDSDTSVPPCTQRFVRIIEQDDSEYFLQSWGTLGAMFLNKGYLLSITSDEKSRVIWSDYGFNVRSQVCQGLLGTIFALFLLHIIFEVLYRKRFGDKRRVSKELIICIILIATWLLLSITTSNDASIPWPPYFPIILYLLAIFAFIWLISSIVQKMRNVKIF